MRGVIIAAVIAFTAGTAIADSARIQQQPTRRDRVVSTGVWSVQGLAGLQGQFEQLMPNRRWSWIVGGGFRFNAGGDYSSSTLAAGAELRWWILGRAVWTRAAPRSPVGWYLGGRLDLSWTRTHDDVDDRTIGQNLATAITATAGYRFVIRDRVELTPMVGLGFTRDIDLRGRLPSWRRATGRLGMTIGWMF